MKFKLEKICRGVYATPCRRFFLEKVSSEGWRLCEQGKLVGYKPRATPLARKTSPLWLRTNNARGAVAWAKKIILHN